MQQFSRDYEVCNCIKVSLGQLQDAITEHNLTTLRQIQEQTKAGTECRHCLMKEGDFGKVKKSLYCMDVLKETLNG